MKAIFNIAKNVRDSHSINALSALRKLQSLGLLLCALMIGSLQMWGAVVSGTRYTTNNSSMPDGWSKTNGNNTSNSYVILNTTSAKIETSSFCAKSFSSITLAARTYGGPSNAQKVITVYWVDTDNNNTAKSLGTISPSNTTVTDYTISSPASLTYQNHNGYIRIKCAGAGSSKGSAVASVIINYDDTGCSSSYDINYDVSGSGSATGDGSAAEGDEVEVTVSPNDGYYLSDFSIVDENSVVVDATRVDATHYTFTMPDAEVWVYATFSAIPSYSVTYNVPACVTSPSGTLTSQSTFAMPTPGVPGYKFEGWVSSAVSTPTSTKPSTIYKPGDYLPSNNQTYYALYCAVSDGFTLKTSNPTSGNYYMLTGSSNAANSKASKNETTTQSRIAYEDIVTTGNVITNTDWALIWKFIKDGDYWYVYNEYAGKYLAASGTGATSSSDYKCTLSTTKNDNSAWTVSVSAAGVLTLTNKARNSASDTNKLYRIGAAGYGGFYSSGNLYIFEQNSVAASYTTNPTCPTTDHTITFNANGGSGSMSPITDIEDGTGATLTSNTFSKDGYSFGGWTADVTVTIGGSPVSPGSTIANGATLQNITSDINLTAIWTPNPYRVDVASPGHVTIGVSSPSTIAEGGNANVNCGATVTLSQSGLESGYSVVWDVYKTGESSTKVSVTGSGNGATFVMPAYGVTVNVTITAPYIYFTSCSNKLKVYYNANTLDASVDNMPTDNNEYDENDYVSIPSTTPTRTGYTFYRWYTNEGCTTPAAGYAVNTSNAFQITANTTLYAKWNLNEYRIDVASPDRVTIKATPSGGSDITEGNHANAEFGQTVTLNYTSLEDGYGLTWDVYKTGDASTKVSLSSTTANNATFTMPAYPVTVTATTEVRPSTTVTFYLGTSNTASGTLSIGSNTIKFYNDEAGITALPTVSSISCGDWNTVVGWTEDGSYSSSTTPPTLITASVGTPYKPATDKTVYAVYRKSDGSPDFDGTNDGTYYVRGTSSSTDYYASSCPSGSLIEDNATSTAFATPFNITKNGDYYNISCAEGKYVTTSGVQSGTDASTDAAKWSVAQVGSTGGEGSGYWLFRNKGDNTKAFSFDARYSQKRFNTSLSYNNVSNSGNSDYVPVALISASTSYYNIDPECESSPTITKGTCTPNSSVLDVDDDACDFSLSATSVSSGGMVTVTLLPNDDYTYNASTVTISGGGEAVVGSINVVEGNIVCNITGITEDMTVNVTYVAKPLYTVTLYDNGTKREELTEEHFGAGVTLPSGNNCGVGSAFAFEGWTESAVELNADPVRPATLHAAGSYVPTSDITLYSVYSKSVDGCDDFAAGVSGAYKMYYDGSKYATTAGTSGSYTGATSGTAEVFYIAYAPAHTGYTIRTSTGFVGWNYDGSELTKANATPYYWKISGSSSNWVITPEPSLYTRQLKSTDGSKFQLYAAATSGKLLLQKSAMTYYYNTAICEENSITFHDGGGTISGTPTTPDGASWNSGTHVLSGLDDCDKITTFPTANYDGWTFVGWSTEDYSNSGKHTTDHPEENASTDEPDGSEIYKTGGNPYVVRGGSIDLYPIFTRFPDNEPFNTESGGDYYIYYLKPGTDDGYGANVRVYATAYDGEKRYGQTTSCAAATEFTFTKDGDIWHIYDKTTSKYVTGLSTQDWLLHADDLSGALDDWTITIKSGNQFNASCQGGGRFISFSTSANYFMDYSTTANPGICLPVYLGSCTERIFSSEPNPTPTIDLTGEPMVTSSVGQQIRATATMTLSAAHLGSVPANKIIVSGTNLKFATTASATPSNTLSLSLTDGSLAATTIYVYYTPTAGNTEDGLENIVVTAKAYYTTTPKDVQTTGIVHARHLPADFVIAAKASNGKWYALPADITSSKSLTDGVLIEVDNANDPTEATAAPNNTKWGLRNVKSGRQTGSGVGDNLIFTERLTTATPNDQKTLYNGSGTSIQVYAQYSGYDGSNPAKYEWVVTESNLKDYTLTSASESRTLSLGTNGKFGALTIAKEYEGKLRLLPAEFYEPAEMQVLEWKANSVVVMYTGTQTTATTKVGTNTKSGAQTLANQKLTHGIYELRTSQSLVANSGAKLEIFFGSEVEKMILDIPIIINSTSTAADGHAAQDVVIVKGGKLTAATTQHNYRNVYVYGGGKLKIESGKSLGVNNIILRAGGISTDGSGGSAAYDYVYPQVELGGTLESAADSIQYEYITDYDHWYQLCLPFDGTLSTIQYPQEYYGDNVTATNTGSWVIKRYAGEVRATGDYDAWKDIETEEATTVTAGHGYIFWGAPKKVTINGDKQRQQWGIQRITMPITAAAATTAETADKNISVDSYSDVEGKSTKPNDQGWNLVGNPYMVNLTNLSSESMIAGELVHTETVPWDGKWRNNGDDIRYVTIPDNHFDNYKAKTASVAAGAGDFMPGRAFFVQIAEGASTLTFAAANRASLMPARFAQTAQSVDIETGIVMSDESKHDEVNFWIKEDKTAEYEYNADYPKTPNNTNFNIYGVHSHGDLSWIAISPEIAEGSMAIGYQVPTAGEYRLSLSETYVSDKIDQLLVTDHEMSPEITTNLLTEDYVFHVNQAETNNTRFTVSIHLAPQTPTDIGNVPSEGMNAANAKPQKFIYHDKLYILRNGVIYDATGKQVKGGLK